NDSCIALTPITVRHCRAIGRSCSDLPYGMFHRRFALPDSADPDGITASGRNGVLEISIPKRPETTPRRIQVGSGGTAGEAGTRQ
ncbi:Hsp20/alpha crystallin family protein, partial [Lysobacter sp. N42]|uniref:Hsp20/alpha crystallin family protein n=1 Tax=Lysobacter sp. N42 TaxID=2545719 RepID=UPI00104F3F91